MSKFRLKQASVKDMVQLSQTEGFPRKLTPEEAMIYCMDDEVIQDGDVQTYGIYDMDAKLVAVMTATFMRVFPCGDTPNGKTVHISGAFTHPHYRKKGLASRLIRAIRHDAIQYGADYMITDSIADNLYKNNGFKPAPDNESRLWRRLDEE